MLSTERPHAGERIYKANRFDGGRRAEKRPQFHRTFAVYTPGNGAYSQASVDRDSTARFFRQSNDKN